jgi:hypothetical protein
MGADYYIIKQLKIKHNQGISIIELERQRCYFNDGIFNSIDSDDSDYEEKTDLLIEKMYLTIDNEPKQLYGIFESDTKPRWKNENIKQRYEDQIKNQLVKENIDLFSSVIKEEVRNRR